MHRFMWAGAFCMLPALAIAQSPVDLDAQFFRPSTGQGFFAVEGARVLPNFQLQTSAFFNFADGPLVAFDDQGEVIFEPVSQRGALDLSFALGLFDFAEIGAALPVAVFQNGDDLGLLGGGAGISGSSLGDIRLTGKARLLGSPRQKSGFFLSFVPELKLPTGDGSEFFGATAPSVLLALAGEVRVSRFTLGANVGPRFQEAAVLDDIVVGNELDFGVGASASILQRLSLLAELEGALSLEDGGQSPLEARGGAKIALPAGFSIPLGAGFGLNQELGAPSFRVFAGISFSPEDRPKDSDKDGILDENDQCPRSPEDKDGFEDEDGCPDDNDRDGVQDEDDLCPDLPGAASLRGCPDQDGDAVSDPEDDCPTEPGEIRFQGCNDQDGDGIADPKDSCPTEAEDFDGNQDTDGCPEVNDRDGDGIPDEDDLCVDEPETFNNVRDQDGCPEDFGPPANPPRTSSSNLIGTIYFGTGQSTLRRSEQDALEAIVARLNSNPSLKVRIEGHADDIGSKIENQRLSERRADRVYKYLVKQGIEPSRIEIIGFGEERPLVEGKTAKARAQNRRVEVVIVE